MKPARLPLEGNFQLVMNVDGGSRGNPGPAGYGVVVWDASGNTLENLSEFIGPATNNVAEYRGLLAGLEYALARGVSRLKIYCDSELIVRQMQGRYRVKSPDLKPLYERACKLVARLDRFVMQHVPREQNAEADLLANQAMDRKHGPAVSSLKQPKALVGIFFEAVVEKGLLRPVSPVPEMEEGRLYEVRLRSPAKGG
jgi:ribonuclease HI